MYSTMKNLPLDHETIVRQCHFDLSGTTTAQRRSLNNKRLSRHTYAITCRTETARKYK